MMGANWPFSSAPKRAILKKYAWFPTKTNSNKWVWLNEYYIIQTYYDDDGRPPVKIPYWKSVLNENEYLIWLIKNPNADAVTPKKTRSIEYYAGF